MAILKNKPSICRLAVIGLVISIAILSFLLISLIPIAIIIDRDYPEYHQIVAWGIIVSVLVVVLRTLFSASRLWRGYRWADLPTINLIALSLLSLITISIVVQINCDYPEYFEMAWFGNVPINTPVTSVVIVKTCTILAACHALIGTFSSFWSLGIRIRKWQERAVAFAGGNKILVLYYTLGYWSIFSVVMYIWMCVLGPICLILTVVPLLLLTVLMVLMGGALTLFERKTLSTYQCRVGPDIVGERGRFQFLVDAAKVLFKEIIFLNKVSLRNISLLPMFFLIANSGFVYLLEFQQVTPTLNSTYLPMLLLLLLMISNYLIVMVGQYLKNRYTRLAAIRAANMGVSIDLLFSAILTILALVNGTLQYVSVAKGYAFSGALILLPIMPVLVITILADIGKPPFDVVESESELVMGVHSDLSGFLFVVWLLGEYLHIFILSVFMTNLLI